MDDYPHIATAVISWLWNEHNDTSSSFWPCDREIDFFLFCQDFLSAVYVSPSVVFLGLKYVQRHLNNQITCDTNERQIFAVSIRLAYKYLEDDSLCPQTYPWSTITQTSSLDLLQLEKQFLLITAYDLSLDDYVQWEDHCRSIAAGFCLNPAILYYPSTISRFASSSSAAAAPPLIFDNDNSGFSDFYDNTNATSIIPAPSITEEEEEDEDEDDQESPISISSKTQQEEPYNLTSQPIDASSAPMIMFDKPDYSAMAAMSMMALSSLDGAAPCFGNNSVLPYDDGSYYGHFYYCYPDMVHNSTYPSLEESHDEGMVATPPAIAHDYNYHRLSGDSMLFRPYYYPPLAPPLPNPAMITDVVDDGHSL